VAVAAAAVIGLGASSSRAGDGDGGGYASKGGFAVLGDLDADAGTVTPRGSSLDVATIDYGATVSFAAADQGPLSSLDVKLAPNERLVRAGHGTVAVVAPIPETAGSDGSYGSTDGLGPSGDFSQAGAGEASEESVAAAAPPPADPADATDTGDENVDSTTYPGGDAVAPAQDGSTIVDDALSHVGNALVVAALTPPTAVDDSGRAVRVIMVPAGEDLLFVLPDRKSAVYPISVSFDVGFNPDYAPPLPTHGSGGDRRSSQSRAAQTCQPGGGAQIVISSSGGWERLKAAVVRSPATCATYYVSVPPLADGLTPRAGSPAVIRALNTEPAVAAAGATFVAVAQIEYTHIPSGLYLSDGTTFAKTARRLGYAMWSIDELPRQLLQPNDLSWGSAAQLIQALSLGGTMPGIAFNTYWAPGKPVSVLRGYKQDLENLLVQPDTKFQWSVLDAGLSFWADETYTTCAIACQQGAPLRSLATHVNAYIQHVARLAFAPDIPLHKGLADQVKAAQTLLERTYLPLTNEWYEPKSAGYGTVHLSAATMKRLVGLQIYAARAWSTDPADNPYAGQRIGIRWTDQLRTPAQDPSPVADSEALAARVAQALRGAYSVGGTALGACDPRYGSSASLCLPADPSFSASTANGWNIFGYWSKNRRVQGAECPSSGGTDVPGGPPNDNFDQAEMLDSVNGPANGTLAGATVQPGEPSPLNQPAPTASVWYCWTPSVPDPTSCTLGGYSFSIQSTTGDTPDADSPPVMAVWTGTDLGSLQWVAASSNGFLVFPIVLGQTYMIEVANIPGTQVGPDFHLMWPIGCG